MKENTNYSKGFLILHAIAITLILLMFSRSFGAKSNTAVLNWGVSMTQFLN
ncbi:hypothetical protein K4A83_13735 [Spirulina subsalsa FACHB-351]|uniref:Uncharacterized protein n=1 Tax=Spirulina subsalsa FACHB-351 TaxID=234711 RepID=A0ABT3L750_9CYAN|nr:hypothetical protein [Spirulina subsalsa]MCW6037324.1 hypothetical protein [Spirulina subsalsa FACHB-351]